MFKHFKSIVPFTTVFLCIFIFDYSYFISCFEQNVNHLLYVWYTQQRTIEKANTNLHVEQWIRSVQLNTNLLPLTCNNINVSMPFLPPFLFDRNYYNFFKIERIPLRLCSFLLFLYVLFSSFKNIVLKTIYRHRLNRSKAT